jgi:hypothetical protein
MNKRTVKILICYLLFAMFFFPRRAAQQSLPSPPQNQIAPTMSAAELNELLARAAARTLEYKDAFRNLTAEETQFVEVFDASGQLERRRQFISDLIVYESQLDAAIATEYRNVRMVDGRVVSRRNERALNLFEQLNNARTIREELRRIERESSRYDIDFRVRDLTINQGFAHLENLRPSFRFEIAGSEQIEGRDHIIVSYQQIAPNPNISSRLVSGLPAEFQPPNPLYRGRLWLDRETAQIRRAVQELTINPPTADQPIVVIRSQYFYTESEHGILVPRRIMFEFLNRIRRRPDRTNEFAIGGRITLEYGTFTRFRVAAQEQNISPQRPE